MKINYLLTTSKFFAEGPCGRVSHAKGFVEGLLENNIPVTLFCFDGAQYYIKQDSNLRVKKFDKKVLYSISNFSKLLKAFKNSDITVIRWRPHLPYVFLPILLFTNKIYFEVNSLTGINSKSRIIRVAVKASIYITSKLSNIIVVSKNSKDMILGLVPSTKSIYIMPNGFDKGELSHFKPNYRYDRTPKNFIYFGRKAEYYDWDCIYSTFSNHRQDLNLHIFGFKDKNISSNIHFYGQFNHSSLIKKINDIENPILLLHPNTSDMAKSGSPMKLYEYAYLNIPVVIGDSLQDLDISTQNFIFYHSGDEISFIESINSCVENYHNLFNIPFKLDESIAKSYSWKNITLQWLNTLKK